VALAALLPGFSALDEYLPLLSREKGAPTQAVPLLYAITALAMAGGSALAALPSHPPTSDQPGCLLCSPVRTGLLGCLL
jgi:hypothetical protein